MSTEIQAAIPLSRWAKLEFGAYAPSTYALRRWVRKGFIQPPPKWGRGKWWVEPTATYKESVTIE